LNSSREHRRSAAGAHPAGTDEHAPTQPHHPIHEQSVDELPDRGIHMIQLTGRLFRDPELPCSAHRRASDAISTQLPGSWNSSSRLSTPLPVVARELLRRHPGVDVPPLIVRHAYTSPVAHLTPYGADTVRTHQGGELGLSETHRPVPKVANVQGCVALACPVVSWRAMLNVA
jgi:hypothetical protein